MTRPLEELFDELSGPTRPLGPTSSVAWPEPAKLRRRAEHRRTVRRTGIASSVAAVAAVAIAAPAIMAGHRSGSVSPAGHQTTAPTVPHRAGAAPVPVRTSATPGSPPTAATVAVGGRRQAFRTFSIVIPEGWYARTAVDSHIAAAHDGHVCVEGPAAAGDRSLYGCRGLDIYYGSALPGQGAAKFNVNRNQAASWHHDTSAAICPQSAAQLARRSTVLAGPLTGPDQAQWTSPWIGNAKANYNVWHVSCADGTAFNPQSWYLPDSHAVFFLYDQNRAAESILSTVVTSRNAANPSR